MGMVKSMSSVVIGSHWKFKNSEPHVAIKVFEINKIRVGNTTHTEVVYGLPYAASGHICQTMQGFLENYEEK